MLVVDGCWLVAVSCRPWSNPSLSLRRLKAVQGDEPGGGGRIEIDYVDFQVAWPGGFPWWFPKNSCSLDD